MSGATGTAVISACQNYRYVLTRPTGISRPGRGSGLFVMLNPSTADASQDDPTIRRCIGFARSWGYSTLVVANLYALRSPSPKALNEFPGDPVGPENDFWLSKLLREHENVVCAWGAHADPARVRQFKALADNMMDTLWCLGTTKSGAPRHPLYVKGDTELRLFEVQS